MKISIILKPLCIISLMTFSAAITNAQKKGILKWEKTYGGSNADAFYSCANGTNGVGLVMTGYTCSRDGGVSPHTFQYDLWVVNTDDTGSIIWQKVFGGSNNDIGYNICSQLGGYIVAGITNSPDGDVTGYHPSDSSYFSNDAWIVQLSPGGSLTWEKAYGGTGDDYARCIIPAHNGGYIFAGCTASSDNSGDVKGYKGGPNDAWIVRIDDTGHIEWAKCYGGSGDDRAYSIIATFDGGYIFAGATASGDGDVSGLHKSATGGSDLWVVKIDSTGSIQWQKCLGGSGDDGQKLGSAIRQLNDSSYIITGYTSSSDGDVTYNRGGQDAWLLKLSPEGAIMWQKTFGGSGNDGATGIMTDDSGYLIGTQTTSNDSEVSGNHGSADFWLLKTDSARTTEWQKCFGGSYYDECYNVLRVSDSEYFMAGYTISSNDDVTSYKGGGDAWVVAVVERDSAVSGIPMTNAVADKPVISPNPFTDQVTITGAAPGTLVQAADITGRVICRAVTGTGSTILHLSPAASGLYYITLQNQLTGQQKTYKLVKRE